MLPALPNQFSKGVTVPWKFSDGIEYTFPLGVQLAAGEYVLVVRNLDAFAERYGDTAGVQLFGPYDGKLSNGGEKLELSKPGDFDDGRRFYIRVDRSITVTVFIRKIVPEMLTSGRLLLMAVEIHL